MSVRNKSFKKIGKFIVWNCTDLRIQYLHLIFHGLIPRQRNSSREPVYAKYRWLHMNYSVEFTLCKKKFRLTSESKSVLLTATKAKKSERIEKNQSCPTIRISHKQLLAKNFAGVESGLNNYVFLYHGKCLANPYGFNSIQ